MEIYADTQALFAQLAAVPGTEAVRTLIENHDAWSHSEAAQALAQEGFGNPPRDPAQLTHITHQRLALLPLITPLAHPYANAI